MVQVQVEAGDVIDSAHRRCLVCRQSGRKSDMLRLVLDEAGQIWPDSRQKAPGRGSYLCMQAACLARLNEKRLRSVWPDGAAGRAEWAQLRRRIEAMAETEIRQALRRLAPTAALGRDAVLQRLWQGGEPLLLLTQDAGEALVRQLEQVLAKRQEAGQRTTLLRFGSSDLLGQMLGREKVSVVALDGMPWIERVERFCAWYGRMKGLR